MNAIRVVVVWSEKLGPMWLAEWLDIRQVIFNSAPNVSELIAGGVSMSRLLGVGRLSFGQFG